MNEWLAAIHGFSHAWANWCLWLTLIITLVVGLAELLSRSVRRRATVRRSVWLAALLCILLSPVSVGIFRATGSTFLHLGWISAEVVAPAAPESSSQEVADGASHLATDATPAAAVDREIDPFGTAAPTIAPAAQSPPAAGRGFAYSMVVLSLVWAAGTVFFLVRLGWGQYLVSRMLHSARGEAPKRLLGTLAQAAIEVGLPQTPRMMLSEAVESPIALGLRRGVVVLPLAAEDWSDAQLQAALMHECAHLANRDVLVGWLQRIAQACLWPHPAIYWLNYRLSRAIEETCDNVVLMRLDRRQYAQLLLDLVTAPARPTFDPFGMALGSRGWKIDDRIAGLLDPRRQLDPRPARYVAPAALALLLAASLPLAALDFGARSAQIDSVANDLASEDADPLVALRRLGAIVEFDEDHRVVAVSLAGVPIEDHDLRLVAHFEYLQELSLADTPVTDAGLYHLQRLFNLRVLEVAHTRVTSDGLVYLQYLSGLTAIGIEGTEITELDNWGWLSPAEYEPIAPDSHLATADDFSDGMGEGNESGTVDSNDPSANSGGGFF